jgi:hypothetical protein
MSDSIHMASGPLAGSLFSDNTTRFYPVSGGLVNGGTVGEAASEIPIRDAGVYSNLYVYAEANTAVNVNCTVTLRKSQADTSVSVPFDLGETGIKEDTSNTASFAATDEASMEVTVPNESGSSKSLSLNISSLKFTPDTTTDCIGLLAQSGSEPLSTPSVTEVITPAGELNDGFTTSALEAQIAYRARFAFTSRNLYTYVSANARTGAGSDTTVKTRKNLADGGQSVVYTASQTGVKEEPATDTDSLAVGDDFNYAVVSGAAGGSTITFKVISTSCVSTGGYFPLLVSNSLGVGFALGTTRYAPVNGNLEFNESSDIETQMLPRFTFVAEELIAYAQTNAMTTGTTTITLRDNGADSAVTVQYVVSDIGIKNDPTNTVTITTGTDEINHKIVNTDAVGAVTLTWIGVLGFIEPAAAVNRIHEYNDWGRLNVESPGVVAV